MKVLYDGNIFSMQKAGGISRYFTEIINNLSDEIQPILLAKIFDPSYFPSNKNLQIIKSLNFRPNQICSRFQKLFFYAISRSIKADIFHPTYYELLSWKGFSKKTKISTIITVWDMIHEIFHIIKEPDGVKYQKKIKREAIFAADHIICISENTKQDLLTFYPQLASKPISVIHLASSLNCSYINDNIQVPNKPYFLFVGSRDRVYKNFDIVLHALSKIKETVKEALLLVVGSPFNYEECKLIEELNLPANIRLLGNINDEYLATLYKNATAFVYPSLYEGFGLPPLEAMACGGIVISSNTSSLLEVVGKQALTFDPYSLDEFIDLMKLTLNFSEQKKNELVNYGFERANLFSWKKTAKQTENIYRTLC